MFTYNTKGTCSRLARLVEGKDIDEIGATLAGIKCRNNTSCPDQLSRAIAAYTEKEKEKEASRA